MKTKKKQLAVIDANTGTVLATTGLYAVLATGKQLDEACCNDSTAYDLALKNGKLISDRLMHSLHEKPSVDTVIMVADMFGWDFKTNNDGEMVLFTGLYGTGRK